MKKIIFGFVLGATIFSVVFGYAVTYIANPVDYDVLVGGEKFYSEPPALEIEGRTYLPLRAISEALGIPVTWNEELRRAEVGYDKNEIRTITPRYSWSTINGSSNWSDFFISEGYLYLFGPSHCEDWSETEETTSGRLLIYNISNLNAPVLTLKHNFGHCNTVHYCKETDELLIGNLPGNEKYSAALYIIGNVSEWIDMESDTFLDFNEISHTIVDVSGLNDITEECKTLGNIAACWDIDGVDGNDVVWISSQYNKDWFKIKLGRGTENLSKKENGGGTYSRSSENKINGTFEMLEHYSFDVENFDAHKEVVQGIDIEDGKIYTANGHDQMYGFIWEFSDGIVRRDVIQNVFKHQNGTIYSAISEGLCIYNGYVYHGFMESQANETWNDYPENKGTKVKGFMKYQIPE